VGACRLGAGLARRDMKILFFLLGWNRTLSGCTGMWVTLVHQNVRT
jgi:hypothetical protein